MLDYFEKESPSTRKVFITTTTITFSMLVRLQPKKFRLGRFFPHRLKVFMAKNHARCSAQPCRAASGKESSPKNVAPLSGRNMFRPTHTPPEKEEDALQWARASGAYGTKSNGTHDFDRCPWDPAAFRTRIGKSCRPYRAQNEIWLLQLASAFLRRWNLLLDG